MTTRVPPPPVMAWADRGACGPDDTVAFFPSENESTRAARRICAGCPVKAQCLAHAIVHGEHHGVWGGESQRARARLRRDPQAVARIVRLAAIEAAGEVA